MVFVSILLKNANVQAENIKSERNKGMLIVVL